MELIDTKRDGVLVDQKIQQVRGCQSLDGWPSYDGGIFGGGWGNRLEARALEGWKEGVQRGRLSAGCF